MIDRHMTETKWENVIIDREGLLNGLTEIAWCAETKSATPEMLYDTYVDKTGESKKEVSSEWSVKFWLLREGYEMFLDSYIRKRDNHGANEESPADIQAGHTG